jgi:cytochrome c556
MMPRMIIVACAFALVPSLSPAHEGAIGIVKERMDAMTEAGKAMKDAGERIRANRSLSGVKDDARTVAAVASRIDSLFPPGSDQRPTDAKPDIWTHWDDFSARAQALERESARFVTDADAGDPGAIASQFRTVGRACADCHDQYRVKK